MLTRSRLRPGVLFLAVLGLFQTPPPARAAGFAIFEQGARSMGFAGAYTAQTVDPAAIFFNAAGIAFLKDRHVALGGTLIHPSSDFTGANPFPGQSVTEKGDAGFIIPPAFDYTQQISENLVIGLGVHLPYGLRTSWENRDTTYSGRFLSKRAEVKNYSINPTVAYKLADRLSVGAGLDFRLSSVSLDRNAPVVNPFTQKVVDGASIALESNTNKGWGFNLGILAKPTDDLSLGASYRHKVKVDYTGNATFALIPTGNSQLDGAIALRLPSGATPVTTSIEFPAIIALGFAYDWNDWTLAADVNFHRWSSFGSLPLTFSDHPELSTVVIENYVNTTIYRVGVQRRLNDTWTLRGGYFHDETPSPPESVSPLLPDANRHGAAVGLTYNTGSWQIDVAYWHLFFAERSTEGVNRDNYNGTYKNKADLLAVSVGRRF